MSSFFDDLEAQLRTAAHARLHDRRGPEPQPPPRGRRAWFRAGLRATPILAGVGTTAAIAVAAFLLLGHHPRSSSASSAAGGGLQALFKRTPTPQLRRELAYINRATNQVMREHACALHEPSGPSFIQGSPGGALLSILGVLRRPPTAADRLSHATMYLDSTQRYYKRYIRRAAVIGGALYYIAPARNDQAAFGPSNHCLDLETSALRRALPGVSPSLRGATLKLQEALIAFDRQALAQTPRNIICLVELTNGASSDTCGWSATTIEHAEAIASANGQFSGVVPDGVASVTVMLVRRAGWSATSAVEGNVFAVSLPGKPNSNPRATIVWHSPTGQVLKTFTQPTAAQLSAYCKAHPVACAGVLTSAQVTSSSASSGSATATVAPSTSKH